jgi:hypothetical protein
MPADEGDIVAKRQQLVADRRNQCCVVSAGQISPADGPVEQNIADMG